MIFCIIKAKLSFFLLILGNSNPNYLFRSIFIMNLTGIGYENNNNNKNQVGSFSTSYSALSSINFIIINKINYLSSLLLLFCTISLIIICYPRIIIIKILLNLNFLPYCHYCANILLCLLLLRTFGYYQFHWPLMFWFINYLVSKSSRIHWSANNKKLINLNSLACYCHCVVVILCLLLLTILRDIINFFKL